MRLAQYCNRAGMTADARAVIDNTEGTLRRQNSLNTSLPRKSHFVRRKATERELKFGLKVVPDGYIVQRPWVTTMEEIGKAAVYRLLDGDDGGKNEHHDASETILVKGSLVPLIIGRAAKNLRDIESQSGTRVNFSRTRDSLARRTCKIIGTPRNREFAKTAILAIIEQNRGQP